MIILLILQSLTSKGTKCSSDTCCVQSTMLDAEEIPDMTPSLNLVNVMKPIQLTTAYDIISQVPEAKSEVLKEVKKIPLSL